MFIAVTIIVSSLFLVIFQYVRNYRFDNPLEERMKAVSVLFLANVLMFTCDIASGGNFMLRMTADISVTLIPLMVVTSSLWKTSAALKIARIFLFIELSCASYYLMCILGLMPIMTDRTALVAVIVFSVVMFVIYMSSMWQRIYDIKELMTSGTVWNYLCQCVDLVYLLSMFFLVMLFMFCCVITGRTTGLHVAVLVFLLGSEMLALGMRVALDSVFVIRHKHERIIVESMKISHVETAASNSRTDNIYKDIYERVLLHFEMKKPFLDNNLTINDVVMVVYSNKVYISKAISHYTGRNFRQFVNYYRVMYSMDLFRNQPSLKVAELASMSGFNSVVSFSSAFRLFMNETPSDWCRKEKTKLIKMKK